MLHFKHLENLNRITFCHIFIISKKSNIVFYHIIHKKMKNFIIEIMVFPLDDNFVFGDFFFFWLIIFFSPKATKKLLSQEKKLLTNKRSYSSNGNPIISMIKRFYAPPSFFGSK